MLLCRCLRLFDVPVFTPCWSVSVVVLLKYSVSGCLFVVSSKLVIMLLNLPVGSTLQWDVSTTCSYCESYSILRSFSMCVASNGCIGNKLRQKTLVCLHIFNSCGFYVTWWKPAITCSYLINSKQICSSELYRLMSPWHLNCIISSFTRAHTHTLGRWRRSAILKIVNRRISTKNLDRPYTWILIILRLGLPCLFLSVLHMHAVCKQSFSRMMPRCHAQKLVSLV